MENLTVYKMSTQNISKNVGPLKHNSVYTPCVDVNKKKGSLLILAGADGVIEPPIIAYYTRIGFEILVLDVYGYNNEIKERWKNMDRKEELIEKYGPVETWNCVKEMLENRANENYEIEFYREVVERLKEKNIHWPVKDCITVGVSLGCISNQKICRSDLRPKGSLYIVPVLNYKKLEKNSCKEIYCVASKDDVLPTQLSEKFYELTGFQKGLEPSDQVKKMIDHLNTSETDYFITVLGQEDHGLSKNAIKTYQLVEHYIKILNGN